MFTQCIYDKRPQIAHTFMETWDRIRKKKKVLKIKRLLTQRKERMEGKKVKHDFKSHIKIKYAGLNNNGGSKHFKVLKKIPKNLILGIKLEVLDLSK